MSRRIRAPLVLRLLWTSIKSWSSDNVPRLGASLAYYTLFALAPILVIAIAIAGSMFGADAVRGDVALLDIGMPNLSGYDVAQRIREQPRGKDMVLVALTGWGQDEHRRRSKEAGFDHHLTKPVELEVLQTILAATTSCQPERRLAAR